METLIEERSPRWAALDRPSLVAWLDSVLRSGSDVSIADDAPFLLEESVRMTRRLLLSNGRPAAHAASFEVTVDLPGGSVRAAIIGAVATDPDFRRQGLGSRVMEAILGDLRDRGVSIVVLWADVPRFYEQLGFVLAGHEVIFTCPKSAWRRPRRLSARPATLADLPAIAGIHGRETCRVRRDERTWQVLFGLPRTDYYVVERDGGVVAYGVVGKGNDLTGTLHEWGGDEVLLPEIVGGISDLRSERELYVMSPPWKRQAARAMAFHGITPHSGALGMMKVLDRGALLSSLGLAGTRGLPEDHAEFVQAVIGCPAQPDPRDGTVVPAPFYLFGLDSM